MFDHMYRTWMLFLLALSGVRQVCGISIYSPSEVEAVNGTDVKLKCTFSSTHSVSRDSVTVSWMFRPLTGGADESVFYYQGEPFPPEEGRFKGHAEWSGDILRKDASITLKEVLPTFNGTYICQVRNRPDVHGSNGETVLTVVSKVTLSEIMVLVAAVGGALVVILIILCIFVAVRVCRRKRMDNDIEMHTERTYEKKDPTVCLPEEPDLLLAATMNNVAETSDEKKLDRDHDDDDDDDDDDNDDD